MLTVRPLSFFAARSRATLGIAEVHVAENNLGSGSVPPLMKISTATSQAMAAIGRHTPPRKP